jgi:hypothetical protein
MVLESLAELEQKVQLVEDLCNSADCFPIEKDAADENNPVGYEAVEKNIDIGTGIETLSGEAAKFVSSSGTLSSVNIMLVLLLSAIAIAMPCSL